MARGDRRCCTLFVVVFISFCLCLSACYRLPLDVLQVLSYTIVQHVQKRITVEKDGVTYEGTLVCPDYDELCSVSSLEVPHTLFLIDCWVF